jgi:nucleotide-binding universal stress UspA family protein
MARMDITQHLQRKFLIVVDGTPESHAALRFAARRAHGTGGSVALLLVIEPESHDHWLGVSTLMKEEAEIEAEKILTESAALVEILGGEKPKTHIRHGQLAEEIARLIDEDRSISTLVLAAAVGNAGPGPLVAAIGAGKSSVHIPVTIVPGDLSDDEIDALT